MAAIKSELRVPPRADRSEALAWTQLISRIFLVLAMGSVLYTAQSKVFAVPSFIEVWGDTGAYTAYGETNVPSSLTNAIAIAAGEFHSLAIKSGGKVVAWGDNTNGKTNVPPLSTVTAVAAGGSHSLALESNGKIVAWGNNTYLQTNVPTGLTAVAIAGGGEHSLALKKNGTVVAWGDNSRGQTNVPVGLTNVTKIAAGVFHNLALLKNGTVVAWGANDSGQCNVPPGLTNVVAISGGLFHSLALLKNGTMVAWGGDTYGQTNIPPGLFQVTAISCGWLHSLALQSNGVVAAWGNTNYGQTIAPLTPVHTAAIAAGGYHSMALVDESAPFFITEPVSQSVLDDGTATVTFVAKTGGTPAASYQWSLNGANIPGSTNASLALTNIQSINLGSYRVVATNSFGSVKSSIAVLTFYIPVAILQDPQGLTVPIGTKVTLTTQAQGTPLPNYQWKFNGSNILGATKSNFVFMANTIIQAGSYSVVVSNAYSLTESASAMVGVIPLAPMIVSPTDKSETSSGGFLVSGLTSTAAGVTNVSFQLNSSGLWQNATSLNNWTNWSAQISLTAGTNVFAVRAQNTCGYSATNIEYVFSIVRAPLTVGIMGAGTVSPKLNGAYLDIGRSYTTTATPGNYSIFTNWYITTSGSAPITNNSPTITFLMSSNLALEANFVNPFVAAAGTYSGLFVDPNMVTYQSAGYLTLTVATNRVFTGEVLLGGKVQSFSGDFNLSGEVPLIIERAANGILNMNLQLDLQGGNQLTGTVSATNFNAQLQAYLSGYSSTNLATNYEGKYTLGISGSSNPVQAPSGYGYGLASVSASGYATFSGSLSDGTAWTGAGPIAANGAFPLYVSLYAGQGAIMSWITFSNGITAGSAAWFKNLYLKTPYYTRGFSLTNIEIMVGPYTPPAKNERVFNLIDGIAQISGGDLGARVLNDGITLNANNTVTSQSTSNHLSIILSASSGLFTGSFEQPVSHKTLYLKGALFPALNSAFGYFLDANQSGSVIIESQEK